MSRREHRFHLVNLGCPKNTVDSEGILGGMALAGFRWVPEPGEADICIVNTCGFLDAARREAREVLAGLAADRRRAARPLLVATGCLVERAGGAPDLDGFLGEADAKVGFADYARLPEICEKLLAREARIRRTKGFSGRRLPGSYLAWLDHPRMRIGPPASAYVKISEGCSNGCAYCSIPLIRGRRASRPMAAILREVRDLGASGAKELNLIAQDTTAYGMDRYGKPRLAALLEQLLKMPGDLWFRVLYAHPRHLTEEVLGVMASDPRVCPYLDLPLQHVSERMLNAMGRGYGRARVDAVIEQIRHILPEAAIRTTFIVGHPGEGKKEFDELLSFVREGHFDHMGVFCWSPEPGTASARMSQRVDPGVANERRERLMEAQARVSAQRLRARRGQKSVMLLERREREGWRGRTPWQAPEVDGATVLPDAGPLARAGDIVPVKIVRTGRYDVFAKRTKE